MGTLLVLAGLPATGKSALATELGRRLNAPVVNKDDIRAALFGDRVDCSDAQNDLAMQAGYRAAVLMLTGAQGSTVIIDGRTYSRRSQLDEVRALARDHGLRLWVVLCRCREKTAAARLAADRDRHPAANRDLALYRRLAASADPIEADLVLDTDTLSPAALAERVIAAFEL